MIKMRKLGRIRLAQHGGSHLSRRVRGTDLRKSADEQIQPAILIVVEEDDRRTASGLEFDRRRKMSLRFGVRLIAEKQRRTVTLRDSEIEETIVIDVAPRRTFDVASQLESDGRGDIGKGAVPIIMEKFAGARRSHRQFLIERNIVAWDDAGFDPDEKIEQTVVIEIAPYAALRRRKKEQARFLRHVFKRAITAIAQER